MNSHWTVPTNPCFFFCIVCVFFWNDAHRRWEAQAWETTGGSCRHGLYPGLETWPSTGNDQESENSLHYFGICPPQHARKLNKLNFQKDWEWRVAGKRDKSLLQISRPSVRRTWDGQDWMQQMITRADMVSREKEVGFGGRQHLGD